jgi:hypothetical protein
MMIFMDDKPEEAQTEIGQWFVDKYIEWQKLLKQKRSWLDFCENYLGSNTATVHRWSSGKQKSYEYPLVERFAVRTRDPKIFELTGHEMPDPVLFRIMCKWPKLTSKKQGEIGEFVDAAEESSLLSADDPKRVKRRKTGN